MDPAVRRLLEPWPGRYGGLPPFDGATPAAIEAAYVTAIEQERREVRAIEENRAPPTFHNTIEALERAGQAARRVQTVFAAYAANMGSERMSEVAKNVSPLQPKLDAEIAHSDTLFARVNAVHAAQAAAGLSAEQRRLIEVIRARFVRAGAGLPPEKKARLEHIAERLSVLQGQFSRNLNADEASEAVIIDDAQELDGMNEETRKSAAAAAEARGRRGAWLVANTRPAVWSVLQTAKRRDLREQVWRMWNMRGDHAGPHDNKPIIAEILKLRGEQAVLLGFADYAHFATAARMAGDPQAALDLLERTWQHVLPATRSLLTDLQGLADAGGATFELAPWDRLYYTEQLRREKFGFDSASVKPYLALDSVLQAMFWAAGRVHELQFREIKGVPVYDPDVRVFEVSRSGKPVAVLYADLYRRTGKGRGSWSTEFRVAESYEGTVLPIVAIISSIERPIEGRPALLTWDEANVWFHEFGHALHMMSSRARYRSLGPTTVPWDFIEVPALLNERWFHDPELLHRFARHWQSGAPMPAELIERVQRAARFERIFSLNLDYLAPSIVDLRMHLLADGRDVDAMSVEAGVLADHHMPAAWDEIMRVPQFHHAFASAEYASGVYGYLWADVIAANVTSVFERSPGGIYDLPTARRWRQEVLDAANTAPVAETFRKFAGGDPDPAELLRRFGLLDVAPRSGGVP